MKLREIIENLDKSEKNSNWCSLEELRNELGLEHDWKELEDFDQRVKSYWIDKHYCTDQWVGTLAYFFDGALVAVSNQQGRKSEEIFSWSNSKDLIEHLRDYLIPEVNPVYGGDLDLEEEWGDGYTVNYYEQLLTKDGTYEGAAVTVVGHLPYGTVDGVWTEERLIIRFADNTEKTIPINEFIIPYGVK